MQTGYHTGCSTSADVSIIITGSGGETSPKPLQNPDRKCFNRTDTDSFLIAVPADLGALKEIEIWHNNIGSSPGWFCYQVEVSTTFCLLY